jgi:hypothetical protein
VRGRRVLVIDDIRMFSNTPDRHFTHAMNSADGLTLLQQGGWDELWVDHDLGRDPETGIEDTIRPVIRFIEEYGIEISIIKILTSNPVGREYIRAAFSRLQERGYTYTIL